MKVKEVEKTANIAWSPASLYPTYLATGTTAQQLDASFSTTSQIDLYSLDLNEPGLGMGLRASIQTQHRFHKLVWGSHGIASGEKPSGLIVGGADQGNIMLYDAAKLLAGKNSETGAYLVTDKKKHSGAVKAIDFNPLQVNLLASGATQSEIFIWDLNSKNNEAVSLGATGQPDDVTCLAWNRQVLHILASTFATRCVMWDLRKNEPIIKVSDSTSRMRCKTVAWHPKVPTQLCLASEDDQMPVIQLWDLRQATAPINTFEGHQRGILSMDWCSQDPDLLLSCGKDNRVLIWNANCQTPRGEIVSELSTSNQWCFDAAWCPRNPACFATASFSGRVGVHSVMGGRELAVQTTANLIADSFPGMDSAPLLQPPQQQEIVHQQLKYAPKWFRPHCGASFGFGGKLVTFGVEGSTTRQVHVSQVVTEEELSLRSNELEEALKDGNLAEYCTSKSESSHEHKEAWNFLAANFSQSPRQELLRLLGYEATPAADLSNSIGTLDLADEQTDAFDSIAAEVKTFAIPTDQSVDGRLCKALMIGDLAAAVDVCFADNRYADAIILAMTGSPELLKATRARYFRSTQGGSVSRLLQAVVTQDWQQIVQHCDTSNWKEALAATLTYADEASFSNLCQTIGQRLESETGATAEAELCYICAGSMEKLVDCWMRGNTESTASLQGLVEQVMVLRQAQQYWKRQSAPVNSTHLTEQLCRYAGLLAGQGSLEAALTYLDLSKDDSMVELKERLQRALGHNSRKVSTGMTNGVHSANPYQRQTYPSMPPKPPTPSYYGHQEPAMFQPAAASAYPARPSTPHQPVNSWAPSPSSGNAFGSPATASFTPMPLPPVAAAVAPPPPASIAPPPQHFAPIPPPPAASSIAPPPTGGSVSRAGPLSQRNRVYVQDPSVACGSGSSNYFNAGASSQYQGFQQTPSAAYQPNLYQPQDSGNSYGGSQFAAPPVGSGGSFQAPNNQFFSPPAAQSVTNGISFDSAAQPSPAFQPFNPMDQAHSSQPASTLMQSAAFGSAAMPSVTPPPALPVIPATVPSSNPPPGWNDPPPLTSYSKAKMEAAVEHVTHPVFATGVVEQPALPTYGGYDSAGILNPAQFQGDVTQQQAPPEPAPVQPAPAPLPIPSEHLVIHDVFHTLKDKCVAQATNAQMKRKLDDVGKKLENLDELLRNNMLLSPTLLGLHQIVQSAQAGDFAQSLSLHSQVVINTPFTEIGSFISGLKTLLQVSQQLGVQYY